MALVLFGVGGLIGNYVFGYLQDYWGRRPSYFVYLLLEIVSCVLSTFAWNFTSWILFRIAVGLTVPAILASPYVLGKKLHQSYKYTCAYHYITMWLSAAQTLAIELVGPQHRVFCTIILNIGYSIGLVLLAGIVYVVRDWRYLSLAVSVPLLLLYSCFFIIPESPRWLIATGQFHKAAKIMHVIAKCNGKTLPDDYEEYLQRKLQRPNHHHQQHIEVDSSVPTIGMLDLFKTPNMRAKTLIITFIWFSNTCVYVGLSYYAPALGELIVEYFAPIKKQLILRWKIQWLPNRWRWDLELLFGRSRWTTYVYLSVAWPSLYRPPMDTVRIHDNRWRCVLGNIFGSTRPDHYVGTLLRWQNGHIVCVCGSTISCIWTVSNGSPRPGDEF